MEGQSRGGRSLSEYGYQIDIAYSFHQKIPEGNIIAQTPPAGEKIGKDDKIKIWSVKGPINSKLIKSKGMKTGVKILVSMESYKGDWASTILKLCQHFLLRRCMVLNIRKPEIKTMLNIKRNSKK